MKILQLISSSGLYGAEIVLLNLSRALERASHRSVVGVFENVHCPNTEIADRARSLGLTVEIIPCRGQLDWSAVRAIRRLIQAQQFDALHSHGYKADCYAYAAARPLRTPVVATCHNWVNSTPLSRLYTRLDHAVLRRFHRIAAVSDAVAEMLCLSGVRPDRITRIDNGVDISSFAAAAPTLAREIQKGARPVVGTVGRLSPEKGLPHFLRAAKLVLAKFPEALFVLVGEGEERASLETLARELGIADSVIFAGQRTDIPGVYASIDVFVLSSLNEGMPMVILEALAAGCAIVATRVGAIPRLLPEERVGLIVSPGDEADLAGAITRLLADPPLRRRMGESGRGWVQQRFSAEAMAERYARLYEELIVKRAAVARNAQDARAADSVEAVSRGRS